MEEVPPGFFLRRARLLDLRHKGPGDAIGPDDLAQAHARLGQPIEPGEALLLWTGHDRRWAQPDFIARWPHLTPDGARWCVAKQPALFGTDMIGVDEPSDLHSLTHLAVLEAGVPQVQVMANLGRLVGRDFVVVALPLKIRGGTGSPVRAVALLRE